MMEVIFSRSAVFLLALLLGLRHGIDWDHIAAITDVTGTSGHKKEAFFLGFLYIIGHAGIVLILGLASVAVGVNLPDWVDPFMERFVGLTLVFLGAWLIASIVRHGRNFRMKSRWMLILDLINNLSFWLHGKIPHRHEHQEMQQLRGKNMPKAALTVGMIHGIGAETPTQVLLFVTAAGVGKGFTGILLLFTFVFGLVISNTLISVLSILGFAKAKKDSNLYIGLGLITAIFSIVVGLLFLFQKGKVLPVIFGG